MKFEGPLKKFKIHNSSAEQQKNSIDIRPPPENKLFWATVPWRMSLDRISINPRPPHSLDLNFIFKLKENIFLLFPIGSVHIQGGPEVTGPFNLLIKRKL